MFLFLRLLLAHLIGDFALQTDEVYKKKIAGPAGQSLHAFILGATFLVFCLPYLSYKGIWVLIVSLTLLHAGVDWLKIKIIDRLFPGVWAFLLDQALHVATLLLSFIFDFSRHAPAGMAGPIRAFYNDDKLAIALSAYLISTFAGTYLLYTFKKTFLPSLVERNFPNSLNYFLIERALITTLFCFLKFYFYPSVILLYPLRVLLKRPAGKGDFVLNIIYSGTIGIILKGVLF